jgi:putative nucleotidyltransferase with HDIG domain
MLPYRNLCVQAGIEPAFLRRATAAYHLRIACQFPTPAGPGPTRDSAADASGKAVCQLTSLMMTASEIVAKARNLPQVSELVLRLTEILGRPDGAMDEAIDLLRSDAILTAKLMRLCNSPAMGLQGRITSVDHAVMLLGQQGVLSLITSLAFGSAMSVALPAYSLKAKELWRHALFTASAAEAAAAKGIGLEVNTSLAFTAGLLHDIGKVLMAHVLPAQAQSAIQSHISAEGLGSVQAEREVIGTDHAEVGACLLYVWRLPDFIVEGVAHHHQPVLHPVPRLSTLVHLANRLVHLASASPETAAYGFREQEQIVQLFELSAKETEDLLCSVRGAEERVNSLMAAA